MKLRQQPLWGRPAAMLFIACLIVATQGCDNHAVYKSSIVTASGHGQIVRQNRSLSHVEVDLEALKTHKRSLELRIVTREFEPVSEWKDVATVSPEGLAADGWKPSPLIDTSQTNTYTYGPTVAIIFTEGKPSRLHANYVADSLSSIPQFRLKGAARTFSMPMSPEDANYLSGEAGEFFTKLIN